MSMRRGIVVEVHPEDHSVDLVMADDGSRLIGVQILTPNGSTRTGTVDLPEIPKRSDKWDITEQTGQDMLAVVGYVGGNPVVTGFLYPQVNQMTHTDPKLKMTRHQSDVIHTVDGDGNIQLAHPSGLYIRIGAEPDKTDYAGKNADEDSAVDRNTSTTPYVRLYMAGGKAVLTIAPDGAVSLTTETTVDVEAQGNISVTTHADASLSADGDITVTAGGNIDVTADGNALVKAAHVTVDTPLTNFTGSVAIAGALSVTGISHMTGNMTTDGNVTVNGVTAVKAITSNGTNISSTHRHSGVQSGGSTTSTPA